MQIAERCLVRGIQLSRSAQYLSRLGILPGMEIDQRQELIRLQESGMRRDHLLQLDDRQILSVLLTVRQTLIVFLHSLVNDLKLIRRRLHLLYIFIRNVVPGPEILADDPLHQRLRDLADPVVDKSQQISRCNILPVILQTPAQRQDRPRHIPDLRLAQTVIIPVVGLI